MTAGTELRQAREWAGLSAENLSERTKIQLFKIEALERDDYAQLPQGIYLDGIVRAYAQEIGMDPEPIVERVRVERGARPGDWEVPFAEPIELYPNGSPDIRVLEPTHNSDSLDGFAAEDDLAAAALANQEEARIATARRRTGIAIPLLALLAAAGWGAFIYERRTEDRDITAPVTVSETRASEPVPYTERTIPAEANPPSVSGATPSAASQDTPSASYTPTPKAAATSGTVAPTNAPVNGSRPAEAAPPTAAGAAPAQTDRIVSPSSTDVTGSWRLATQIESTSYAAYSGLRLGYEMKLEQEGGRVTGTGRKITENGNGIGPRAQTPVTVSGTIEGDRLTLNFVERGARRPTQGKFVLLIDDEGTLRGRFSSNAAKSSGRVEAYRVAAQ